MDQPLGYAVGNALEVIEAINTLKGEGPEDLTKLVLNLGTYMVLAARDDLDKETVRKELERVISDGSALDKMAEFVKAQGGDPDAVYNTDKLKISDTITEVCADSDGYIQSIQSELIGKSSMILGGGRAAKDDVIESCYIGSRGLRNQRNGRICASCLSTFFYSLSHSFCVAGTGPVYDCYFCHLEFLLLHTSTSEKSDAAMTSMFP